MFSRDICWDSLPSKEKILIRLTKDVVPTNNSALVKTEINKQ